MSVGTKLLQAAAGNAGEAVYVDDVFSTFLYKGNGSTQNIVNGLDLSGEGGMVWLKGRDVAEYPAIYDTARGQSKVLYSALTSAQASNSDLSSFNSNGFSLSYNYGQTNTNNKEYVAWSFRKQEKFFDIVTYTGDGTTSHTINHNLGSVPGMIIVKRTDASTNWSVYHRSSPVNASGKRYNLRLQVDNGAGDSDFWPTTPTSTQFFLGDSDTAINASGGTYVAYLFGHNEAEYGENSDEAIIYCDSFTTTSTWGNFKANIGFEPQWILVKRTDSADNWIMLDMMRGVTGPGDHALADTGPFGGDSDDQELKANAPDVESTQGRGGFYSNGYLGNLGGFGNANYVYMAIRRPNKPASEFAANKLFSMDGAGNASGDPDFVSNDHIVDWAFLKLLAGSEGAYVTARPTGSRYISLSGTAQEYSDGSLDMDFQSGFGDSASGAVANYQAWMLRRAKGFFDIVAYVGTGSATTVSHNLGVAPELILVKRRNGSADWVWYVSALGAGKYLYGDGGAELTDSGIWNNTAPTSSVFSLNSQSGSTFYRINGSGDTYIAVLWATVAGISKVGSYTGTGSDLNVDCGFSAGARFVLIKRTDASSDGWYVFDSERGIVAGDDPYFLLNSSAAQVTNTDYIDPLSSGFTVTSSAPAALNASSGNYIFLAIA